MHDISTNVVIGRLYQIEISTKEKHSLQVMSQHVEDAIIMLEMPIQPRDLKTKVKIS